MRVPGLGCASCGKLNIQDGSSYVPSENAPVATHHYEAYLPSEIMPVSNATANTKLLRIQHPKA